MLSSHLSRGLPLGLIPFIFNFITHLNVGYSSLFMTWPNHLTLFCWLLEQWVALLLCLYRNTFLLLSHLVTPLCDSDNFHVCCCNLLFWPIWQVQHSLPKIRIGLRWFGEWYSYLSWWQYCHSVVCTYYIWRSCSWPLLLRCVYCRTYRLDIWRKDCTLSSLGMVANFYFRIWCERSIIRCSVYEIVCWDPGKCT